MQQLEGRVAIVTGASRGIGKAVAKLFAQQGARVVVTARSETDTPRLPGTIHQTVAEIRESGGEALAIRCDVRHEEDVNAMAQQAVAAFGSVDVLVNNAAATFPASGSEIPIKRWDVIMDVNVRGYFLCIRAFLPEMMKRGNAAILNMTSGAGEMVAHEYSQGMPSLAYGVSKAAINKMTLGFAQELESHGVSVNALMPKTPVATEGAIAFFDGKVDASYTDAGNMAQAALYLVCQTAATRTGWIGYDEDLREESGAW